MKKNKDGYKIAIVDDAFATRDGYKNLLAKWDQVSVVKTYAHTIDLLKELETFPFNLVFMDIELSGENGLDVTRELKNSHPDLKVIMVSSYHSEQYILDAYTLESDGYLFKDAEPKEVRLAIQTVLEEDNKYFNQEATSVIFKEQEAQKKKGRKGKVELSERERQILRLMCEAKSNDQIAAIIKRAPATISTHRQNIMNKIGAHNGYEVVNYATQNGLWVPPIKNLTKK